MGEMEYNDGVTLFLALWGALLSTAIAGWNVYRDLVDRGKVVLSAMIAGITGVGDVPKALHLAVTMTNVGRRRIHLLTLWIRTKEGLAIVKTDSIPATLEEGEYRTQLMDPDVVNECLKDIYVIDSYGTRWRLGRKMTKRLKREATSIRKRTNKAGRTN